MPGINEKRTSSSRPDPNAQDLLAWSPLRLGALAWKPFLFLLLCASPALAAPRFDHFVLKGPCQFKEIITQDLDRDGRADVLATCVAGNFPNYKRSLALFRQRPNGSFAEAPDQMIALDRQAAIVDVADVLPDPGQEILLLGPEGVRVLTQSQGLYTEPKPFISHPTFVALADPGWSRSGTLPATGTATARMKSCCPASTASPSLNRLPARRRNSTSRSGPPSCLPTGPAP